MKSYLWAAVSALLLVTAAPAAAQTLSPGTKIVDTQGQPVGTVTTVIGNAATVQTDRHEARLPLTSIRVDKTQGVVAMTQAELNASIDQAMAQLAASIAPGTTVYDLSGSLVGTVGAVGGDLVTLRLPSAREVRLPRASFSMGRSGLLVGTTAAQLEAQLQQGS